MTHACPDNLQFDKYNKFFYSWFKEQELIFPSGTGGSRQFSRKNNTASENFIYLQSEPEPAWRMRYPADKQDLPRGTSQSNTEIFKQRCGSDV